MAIRLARNLGPVTALAPREYTVETASGLPAVCCPSCGGISDIEHEVYRDGRVARIWSCPYQSCPLVTYLDLECWGEEVLS